MTLIDIRIQPRTPGGQRRLQPQPRWNKADIIAREEQEVPRTEYHGGRHRVAVTADMGRKTQSRFALKPLKGRPATMPPFDSPAVVEGRTIYTSTVVDPVGQRLLKSGHNQAKIGRNVLKGRWKGMPIYCLTLEERKTCPTDCQLWRSCYGNGMHQSVRFRHGPELEAGLHDEVAQLSRQHPDGFVVRLHILGDFYSVEYVRLWARLLEHHPELNIWGYTARWGDPIAAELIKLGYQDWERFSIRFSNAPIETCSTVTIEHVAEKPADAVICPAQLGQTESCATCGYCWDTDKRVAFIRH